MLDAKSLGRTALLALVASTALLVSIGEAGAAPNCKPNRATCTANHQCCSGFCGSGGLCAATPTTTTTVTTTTSTSSTTSSTTTTMPRFVDNGDGTVTDNDTGLQWEKKVQNVCSNNANTACTSDSDCPGGSCAGCLHCVDDPYTWCAGPSSGFVCSNSSNPPDGTAFTSFLTTLNGGATGVGNCVSSDGSTQTGGFDNHCDWRLPTIAELRTIVDTSAPGCGTATCGMDGMQPCPCIDATFGPTEAFSYWSSTTVAGFPDLAWFVLFSSGDVFNSGKTGASLVRAVRGGCACTGGKVLNPSGMCVCPSGQTEDASGTCQCPSGQTKCNGNCTNTQTDPNNCGTCGTACGAGGVCNGGSCCTPNCAGKTCGPNGCGGFCGTCTAPAVCDTTDNCCVSCIGGQQIPCVCT